MKSLISIDTIGFDLCSAMGDSVYKNKAKLTKHLIDGYSEMNTYIGNAFSVKTAVLKFDNVIEMPCDFVYETKVGIRDLKSGRIALLALDKGVERKKLNDSETQAYINDIWTNGYGSYSGYYFYNAYAGGRFLGELYGAGRCVINSGTYSIDKGQGVIYIGGNIPVDSEIVIEYKADGVTNGLTLVPREMKLCLEFFAKYMFYADKNPNLSVMNEQRYKKAYNKLQRLYNYETALYASARINEMFSPTNY